MIGSLLIANRGEIAVRIIRACRELGVRSIAVYSDADADALHVRLADAAHRLGPAPVRQSYLDIAKILDVAAIAGAEAIHPGYGLLSENPDFAAAAGKAGLIFIGPSPEVIALMGDKIAARAAAARAGVPVLPGSTGVLDDHSAACAIADRVGYPVAVKACFGGGGRGLRVVRTRGDLARALDVAARESALAFGRGELFIERYLERPRHVEVQILADRHGNVVHLGDRDCSVQRRHQKLIEEAPAPDLPDALRNDLANAAIGLAASVKYEGAGTVEYLVEPSSGSFYFLEMNTRLQVEHGVTELVTGVDIVQSQIRIAAGERLAFDQRDVAIRGHAIEARISAEDPWEEFRPAPGRIERLHLPLGPWLRLDFGAEAGDAIPPHYDSMFGKVQVWAPDRERARARLSAALEELSVVGLPTTAPYLGLVLRQPEFVAAAHDTQAVERDWSPDRLASFASPHRGEAGSRVARDPGEGAAQPTVIDRSFPLTPTLSPQGRGGSAERRVVVETSDGPLHLLIPVRPTGSAQETRADAGAPGTSSAASPAGPARPIAPMDGTVVRVEVKPGDRVEKGAVLVVLEAMKMELPVLAAAAETVDRVLVAPGDVVAANALLVAFRAD